MPVEEIPAFAGISVRGEYYVWIGGVPLESSTLKGMSVSRLRNGSVVRWYIMWGSAGWGCLYTTDLGGMNLAKIPSDEDGIPDGLVWVVKQQNSGITSFSSVQASACACIVVFTLCYIYFPLGQIYLPFCLMSRSNRFVRRKVG